MFEKAKIEIYDLELDDIIVTSTLIEGVDPENPEDPPAIFPGK